MLFNSYSYEILYEQFHWIYLQEDIKLLLVTVNNRLKFEIEIVHDLSCHPIDSFELKMHMFSLSFWVWLSLLARTDLYPKCRIMCWVGHVMFHWFHQSQQCRRHVCLLRPASSWTRLVPYIQTTAVKFFRQWTEHLEQGAACTTSTRAVTEHCTEDVAVLVRLSAMTRFTRFRHWKYLLTYLLTWSFSQTIVSW